MELFFTIRRLHHDRAITRRFSSYRDFGTRRFYRDADRNLYLADGSLPVRTDKLKRKPKGTPLTVDYFFERSMPEPNSGCWIWLGAIQRNGYGVIQSRGLTLRAHREVYQVANGMAVPSSIDVCHRCDVRSCVNPEHLFQGTRKDNMRDCANKGRTVTPRLMGERCPASILKDRDVIAIRASRLSQRELGRRYGVDKGTISHIVHRKTWRHL